MRHILFDKIAASEAATRGSIDDETARCMCAGHHIATVAAVVNASHKPSASVFTPDQAEPHTANQQDPARVHSTSE